MWTFLLQLPGTSFTDNFFITIQMWWKFHYSIIQILIKWSLQYLAHGAVVACAKFCCDMITSNWIRAKWNFHRIWIVREKSLAKWANISHINGQAFMGPLSPSAECFPWTSLLHFGKNHVQTPLKLWFSIHFPKYMITWINIYFLHNCKI